MEVVIVEVVNRFGQVKSRHRLASFPATIGRALTNDVIVDDSDVSALHARIEQTPEGDLELVDVGATNGITVNRKKISRMKLAAINEVRVASVHLRLLWPEGDVPKTVIFRLSRLENWHYIPAAVMLFALSVVLSESWVKAIRVHPAEVLSEATVLLVVAVGGWAFIWSLASRVAHGQFKIVGHFNAAAIAFSLFTLIDHVGAWLCSILRFGQTATSMMLGLAFLAVAAWLLFQHLSRVVPWKPMRTGITSVLLAAAVGLLLGVAMLADTAKYTSDLPLAGAHVPPMWLIGPVSADADVPARVEALRQQVDALKAER